MAVRRWEIGWLNLSNFVSMLTTTHGHLLHQAFAHRRPHAIALGTQMLVVIVTSPSTWLTGFSSNWTRYTDLEQFNFQERG